MGLKYTGSAGAFAPGVFINKVKIASIVDVSGVADPFGNTYDLSIEVKIDIGKVFQPTQRFKGNLEYDAVSHQPIGFGTARGVGQFFQALGVTLELDETNRIPADTLVAAQGREYYRLQYLSAVKEDGKLKYSDFSNVIGTDKDPKLLFAQFERGLKKEKPYPNNFHPELLEAGSTAGGNGEAPSAAPSSPGKEMF